MFCNVRGDVISQLLVNMGDSIYNTVLPNISSAGAEHRLFFWLALVWENNVGFL